MPVSSTAPVPFVPGPLQINISSFIAVEAAVAPFLQDGCESTLPGVKYFADSDGQTWLHCDPSLLGNRDCYLDQSYVRAFANPAEINVLIAPGLPRHILVGCRHRCLAVLRTNVCGKESTDPSCPHGGVSIDRRVSSICGNNWVRGGLKAKDVSSSSAFRAFVEASLQADSRSVLPWWDPPFRDEHPHLVALLSAGSRTGWPVADDALLPSMVAAAQLFTTHLCFGDLEQLSARSENANPLVAHCTSVVLLSASGSSPTESTTQSRLNSALYLDLCGLTPAFNLSFLRWVEAVHAALSDLVIDESLPESDHDAAVIEAVTSVLTLHFSPVGYSCDTDLPVVVERYLKNIMEWLPPVGASPSKPGRFHEGATVSLGETLAAFAEYLAIARHYADHSGYLRDLPVQPTKSTPARKVSQRLAVTPSGGESRRLTLPARVPVLPVPSAFPSGFAVEKVLRTSNPRTSGHPTVHPETLLGSRSATLAGSATFAATSSPTAFAHSTAAAGGGAASQSGGGAPSSHSVGVAAGTFDSANPFRSTSAAAPQAAPPSRPTADVARLDRMEQQSEHIQQQLAQLLASRGDRTFGHNPSGTHSERQVPAADAAHHQQPQEQALAEDAAYRPYLQEQQRQQPHSGGIGFDPTGGYEQANFSQRQQVPHHTFAETHPQMPQHQHPYHQYASSYLQPPQRASGLLRPQDRVVPGYSRANPGDLCLIAEPGHRPSAQPTQPQHDVHRSPPFYAPPQIMQRPHDDLAQPAAGIFAPGVASVPAPWNECGDVFANVNIGSPEQTAQAFGELHDLQTPLVFASKNCEQSYWERYNLINSHQNSTLIKRAASGTCIEELKQRFASEAADARAWSATTVRDFTATPDAFDAFVTSMQSLCNSMSRPLRFGSLPHVFISQTRDFALSLALFKATQLQAGVPWSDIMTRFRALFASFAALRTFCEQRSARYGKVWFHVRLLAYLSHVGSSVTPWIDDGVRDSRAILTGKAIRDLEAAQKSALAKLAAEQSAALARIEKAALAAASAAKAADTSASVRRRDQRLCKGCSVRAGADRRTLCHMRDAADGSAVGCPNAAQAANYPAAGYK
jgi:hypothetical protein